MQLCVLGQLPDLFSGLCCGSALKTEAFYWLAIVPFLGFLTCVLIKWEPLGANVDAEDAEVLAELDK